MSRREVPIVNQDEGDNATSNQSEQSAVSIGDMTHLAEGTIVTVLIGPKKSTFRIQKDPLSAKVPYFKALFGAGWDRGEEKPVDLSHIDVRGFRVLMRWLFGESLPVCSTGGPLDWKLMDIAYKVADELAYFEAQNYLIDCHLQGLRNIGCFWWFSKIEDLKKLQLDHTPYYRLVKESAVSGFMDGVYTDEQLKEELSKLDEQHNISTEILLGEREFRKNAWLKVYDQDRCSFHSHNEGKMCDPWA